MLLSGNYQLPTLILSRDHFFEIISYFWIQNTAEEISPRRFESSYHYCWYGERENGKQIVVMGAAMVAQW